jgi:site-specific DNA recombinase
MLCYFLYLSAMALKIGIWLRVSTEDQVNSESLETHHKRAEMYAQAKGWEIAQVYRLEAVSGKSVLGHPETKRMMSDIKNGIIVGLVFSKLARLARNTRELLEISDHFRKYDADLISLYESIDTSSPAGRLYFTLISAMSTWEREEISERVAQSVPIRANMGLPLGGQAPYGYQWKDKKLIVDEKEAPIRKLMFELFVKHKRVKHVAKLLNEQGHRTRNNSPFSDTTLKRLLIDPIAKGLRRANYTRSLGAGKHWEEKPEEEWVFKEAPAIVDEKLWEQVNGILKDRASKRTNSSRLNVHLFGGIAMCTCGGKMYVRSNTLKYVCIKCKKKIPIDDLENIFYEALLHELDDHQTFKLAEKEKEKLIKTKEEQLTSVQRSKTQTERDIRQLFVLNREGQLATQDFSSHYKPIKEKLHQLEDTATELHGQIDILKVQTLDVQEIMDSAIRLRRDWKTLSPDQRKELIRRCVKSIVVGDTEVTITLIPDEYISFTESTAKGQHNLMDSYWQQA